MVAKKNENHFSEFDVVGIKFGPQSLPIFAGPNMVESEDLIIKTAKEVKSRGASFLRGGAFKPLTFPYRSSKYNETRELGRMAFQSKIISGNSCNYRNNGN